ncbi:ribonuclease VapC [Mesorhizobium soli]|uniref:type II toxin-antitoxin system VapC family toxin n=1 Tax=Pseudaminobacter soli (ex Li et al. 2025) TaxID=1295366 RepID=UPI0024770335|nr:type II toxin-antitoxin system VapC family toxin [Mesorhizobium soli]MDH6230956.1 ribonuclease VapC [Mesorhizobium soli]
MIVDASALLAIVLGEEDGDSYSHAIADELDDIFISPINFVEAAIKADKKSPETGEALDEVMRVGAIKLAQITRTQAQIAREAYQKFGKGNHEARLNLGDCFAYALAKARSEKLLFKGDDFRKTDIEAAL